MADCVNIIIRKNLWDLLSKYSIQQSIMQVSLTHTPSPMNYWHKILNHPENEKPFLLLAVGYRTKDAKRPHIFRKSLDQIRDFNLKSLWENGTYSVF